MTTSDCGASSTSCGGKFGACYMKLVKIFTCFQCPLLLLIRLYWGWGFLQAGRGKFANPDRVLEFFTSMNIPWPAFNVYLVATVESVCGLLLIFGLASRLATIPLIVTMCVALATADAAALATIWTDPKAFLHAEPFLYLFACVIVLCFGPGKLSLDGFLCRKKDAGSCCQ